MTVKFTCPHCGEDVVVPADHKSDRIGCGECWQFVEIPADAGVPIAEASSAQGDSDWYYAKPNETEDARGPVAFTELQKLASNKGLLPFDFVRRHGKGSWVSAKSIDGLQFNDKEMQATEPLASRRPPNVPRWLRVLFALLGCAGLYFGVALFAGAILRGIGDYQSALQTTSGRSVVCGAVAVVFFGIPAIWRFVMGTTRRGTSASGNVDSSESTSTESSATKLTRKQALFVVAVYGAITTAVGISVVIWMFPSSNDGGAPRIDLRAEPHVLDLPLPASPELITKSYKPRVYRIEVTFTEHVRKQGLFGTYVEEGNAGGLGSGVLIANDPKVGILVTNRHVIDPGHNDFNRWATDLTIKVRNPLDTQWTRARVAAVHRTYDLALLLVERNFERSEVIKIAGQVVQGEQAVAIGNPEGIEFLTSTGIISGKLPNGMISTTCPISQGSSGGPLILIRHGYLAGITTSSFPSLAAQNLNSAVPATATVDGERTSGWTRERAAKDFEKAQRLVKLVPVMEE